MGAAMFNGNIVLIGVSTGGPVTLRQIFSSLPPLKAAVIVILHITPGIDCSIARSLNTISSMPVTLATDGEQLQEAHVYLAPAGHHLELEANFKIRLRGGEKVNFVMPAADVAFCSVHKPTHGRIVATVLTGMGKDGAEGIRHIKKIGGQTIAQDQKTSIIYGMPKAAWETGAVDHVLPLEKISPKLVELINR